MNQARLLAWLALDGGRHHPADVVRWSGAGPTQGFHALGQLVAAGWVVRAGDRLQPEVGISPAGRRRLRAVPLRVHVFARSSVRADGTSLHGLNVLGRPCTGSEGGSLGDGSPGGAWPEQAGSPPACQREALGAGSGYRAAP